jgi:hypothetical protein
MKLSTSEILFTVAALVYLASSIALWFSESKIEAIFIGLWVLSIWGWMNFPVLKKAGHSQGQHQ